MAEDPKDDRIPRRGPNPLPAHVGLAMAEYACLQNAGPVAREDVARMLEGIKKYQEHPYRRSMKPLPVVWEKGQTRMLHCTADQPVRAALFLVPSLVNKSFILDLLPEKSFVRWLAMEGIEIFLLDWGSPVEDEGLQDIEGVAGRLGLAMEVASIHAVKNDIHALGYCMGGTLLAAAAMQKQRDLRSIIFMASPWDFVAGDRFLATQVQFGSIDALQMIAHGGTLPRDWIQSVFAATNANRAMEKFSAFTAMEDDSAAAQLFVAVEDWLNDGVDLPGPLAQMCINDWYIGNKPGKGEWEVGGQMVDLKALDVPALVVASLNDRLVPRESSLAMAGLLPRAKTLEPSCGHIGMITGRQAEQQVWQPVVSWINEMA